MIKNENNKSLSKHFHYIYLCSHGVDCNILDASVSIRQLISGQSMEVCLGISCFIYL